MTEEKLMDKYPFNPDWFVEKGLPVCSVMPNEYYEEMEAKESEGEKPEEKPEGEEPKEIDELLKKSRDELNALAEEKGLDPGDYHNKEEIVKAILEAEE